MTSCADYRQWPVLIPDGTSGLRLPSCCHGMVTFPSHDSQSDVLVQRGKRSFVNTGSWVAPGPRIQDRGLESLCGDAHTPRIVRGGVNGEHTGASLWSCRQSHFTNGKGGPDRPARRQGWRQGKEWPHLVIFQWGLQPLRRWAEAQLGCSPSTQTCPRKLCSSMELPFQLMRLDHLG